MSDAQFPSYQPPGSPEAAAGEPNASVPAAGSACPFCGSQQAEPGYIDDAGDGAVRWFAGEATPGLFGGLPRFGVLRRYLVTRRCLGCGHLTLFATDEA